MDGTENQIPAAKPYSPGFINNHPVKLDSALRAAVPASFKEVLKEQYGEFGLRVVVAVFDERLKVYPISVWQQLEAELLGSSFYDGDADDLNSVLYGNMSVCPLDAQGRVRITPQQAELAGITGKDAVFVGKRDFMEIWDAERWKAFTSKTAPSLKDVMARVRSNRQGGGLPRPGGGPQ